MLIKEPNKALMKTIVLALERKTSSCKFINCKLCLAITKSNTLTSTQTKKTYQITQKINCESENVIYVLTCKHCQEQYVGQTSNTLQDRITKHKNDAKYKNYLIYQHVKFHKLNFENNFTVTPIQQVAKADLTQTETKWRKTLTTLYPKGLNSKFEKHSDTNEVEQELNSSTANIIGNKSIRKNYLN